MQLSNFAGLFAALHVSFKMLENLVISLYKPCFQTHKHPSLSNAINTTSSKYVCPSICLWKSKTSSNRKITSPWVKPLQSILPYPTHPILLPHHLTKPYPPYPYPYLYPHIPQHHPYPHLQQHLQCHCIPTLSYPYWNWALPSLSTTPSRTPTLIFINTQHHSTLSLPYSLPCWSLAEMTQGQNNSPS